MLSVFNDLKPFFEDNYRRISVREYARMAKISPPSASKLLNSCSKEALLNREKEKNYIYYVANKENKVFIELSRIYWFQRFENSGLIEHLRKEFLVQVIVLFGSFSKAEIRAGSDVDIAIFNATTKAPRMNNFEKKLGRKIQLFIFKSKEEVENKDLLSNILNGFILLGGW